MPGSSDTGEAFTKEEYERRYPKRFFIGSDDDGHYYLVPLEQRADWMAWEEHQSKDVDAMSDVDRDRAWTPPEYARRINGWSSLTFTDPKEDNV